jgi:GxxExxY protein
MAIVRKDILFADEAYKIIGACMKVQTDLRKGFKEIVYKNAMVLEFKKRNILLKKKNDFILNMMERFYQTALLSTSFVSIQLS